MLDRRSLLAAALIAGGLAAAPVMEQTASGDPENTLYLDLKDGRVVIRLRPIALEIPRA